MNAAVAQTRLIGIKRKLKSKMVKKKKNVAVTSVISYYAILNELSKRQLEVLNCIKNLGRCVNNKMVHEEMKKKYPKIDISSICGRMYELRKDKNLLLLDHIGVCPITGETSKFYRIKKWIQEIQ